MKNKSMILRKLEQAFGENVGLLSIQQIMDFTGVGKDMAQTLILGLPHIGIGKGKRYFIDDIAESIAKHQKR